jgi:hypothetical protein
MSASDPLQTFAVGPVSVHHGHLEGRDKYRIADVRFRQVPVS